MTTNLQTVMFSGLQVFLIGFEYKMSTNNYSTLYLLDIFRYQILGFIVI